MDAPERTGAQTRGTVDDRAIGVFRPALSVGKDGRRFLTGNEAKGRNTSMKAFAALAVTTALGMSLGVAEVRAEALKIGIIESLSGAQTSTGRLFATAAQFVVDQINAEGGFNGAPIEVVEYDNAGGATDAAARFRQAAADGVHVVLQGASSAIAGQITEDVRRHNMRNPGNEVMYLNLGAEALELTGDKCHFYHFRFTTTAPMRVNALVSAMKEEGVLGTKVYSINQNYSWGRDMEEAIKGAAATGGYEVVDSDLHEVNRIQDFSPFVAKIRASGAETVITGNWSNDLLLLMKAAGDAGLDVRFGTTFLDMPGSVANAGETAVGHYIANLSNLELADEAANKAYQDYSGHLPVYIEPQTVNAITMLRSALSGVDFGGGDINVTAIAQALEKATLETPNGTLSIRPEDHQVVTPVVVSRVEEGATFPADDTKWGFVPVKVVGSDEAIYPVQASRNMERPG
jgi:branched-chain amino acid transport system substrate-binding protein